MRGRTKAARQSRLAELSQICWCGRETRAVSWLSRAVHAVTSVGAGRPTLDPGADVRERIGSSRTESPHRDLPSDVIEWRWDGARWGRWSALSRRHDRIDLPVPESLSAMFDESPAAGAIYRYSDGVWVEAPDQAAQS